MSKDFNFDGSIFSSKRIQYRAGKNQKRTVIEATIKIEQARKNKYTEVKK